MVRKVNVATMTERKHQTSKSESKTIEYREDISFTFYSSITNTCMFILFGSFLLFAGMAVTEPHGKLFVHPKFDFLGGFQTFNLAIFAVASVTHIWYCIHLDRSVEIPRRFSIAGLVTTQYWRATSCVYLLVATMSLPQIFWRTCTETTGILEWIMFLFGLTTTFFRIPYGSLFKQNIKH